MSAYAPTSAPMPPPPSSAPQMGARSFSNAYGLHQDAVSNLAGSGMAPVNQMTNGFGGRQGGNPNMGMQPGISGGNRGAAHVAGAMNGNHNVTFASPTLLASSSTLWQKAMNKPGSPGPANGMSTGFIQNNEARNTGVAAPPVPPPMTTVAAAPAAVPTLNPATDPAAVKMADQKAVEAAAQQQQYVKPVPIGTAAPKVSMTLAQAQAAYTGPKTMRGPNGSTIRTPGWTSYLQQNGLL